MKDEYQRTNLHREARVMAILRHPNIVRLYETLKVIARITLILSYAQFTVCNGLILLCLSVGNRCEYVKGYL